MCKLSLTLINILFEYFRKLLVILSHTIVQFDRPGERSPEKDCCR